jgi:hypothetical protein
MSTQETPHASRRPTPSVRAEQQMVAFARCMRQHGINVPDPGASGGIEVKGGPGTVNPDSSQFKAAERACQQYAPKGGDRQTQSNSAGGGQ